MTVRNDDVTVTSLKMLFSYPPGLNEYGISWSQPLRQVQLRLFHHNTPTDPRPTNQPIHQLQCQSQLLHATQQHDRDTRTVCQQQS